MQEAMDAKQVRRLEMRGVSWYNHLGEIAEELVKRKLSTSFSLRAHAARLRALAQQMENTADQAETADRPTI